MSHALLLAEPPVPSKKPDSPEGPDLPDGPIPRTPIREPDEYSDDCNPKRIPTKR